MRYGFPSNSGDLEVARFDKDDVGGVVFYCNSVRHRGGSRNREMVVVAARVIAGFMVDIVRAIACRSIT
jgi:hypothetical protein